MMRVFIFCLPLLGLTACGTKTLKEAAPAPAAAEPAIKPAPDHTPALQPLSPAHMLLLEQKLNRMGQQLFSGNDSDTLAFYSNLYGQTMLELVYRNPASFTHAFDTVRSQNNCFVITSPDARLRVYSWDNGLGGTMRFFDNIYQYRLRDSVQCRLPERAEDDNNGYYSELYLLDSSGAQRHYLAIFNRIGSTRDVYQGARIFTLGPQGLSDSTALFETERGRTGSLGIGFNFFSVVDRPERPLRLVVYDTLTRTLSVPVVGAQEQVTDRNDLYRYNGRVFVKTN